VRRFSAVALLAGVAGVALLPLYGDPTPTSLVSHPEWARMLLRGLDLLTDAPGVNDTAVQAFATLSGRDSRAFAAGGFVRSLRVELVEEKDRRFVRPTTGIGEAVYALGVARPGDYRLRLQLSGATPAEAELTRAGDNTVLRRFSLPAAPVTSWIDAGEVHLDAGAYDATVLLPEGSTLEHVELAPPCVSPIEPRGGWRSSAVATGDDVAVTVLQALDLESELPQSGSPLEFRGSELRLESGAPAAAASLAGGFRGGPRGARVLLLAEIPTSGLYTLSVFGVPSGGQRWLIDGCRSTIICPATDAVPRWRTILSARLSQGPHAFVATLGPDTLVERVRIEPKKDGPEDYLATVKRLGLELGGAGPVSRDAAEEARRFVERRRLQLAAELCGDILRPGTLVAELAGGGQAGGAGTGNAPGGGTPGGGETQPGTPGEGGGPVPPPIIPPLPPPSPTLPVGYGGD
jgi:hypothetical protein